MTIMIIHIAVALASLLVGLYLLFRPSLQLLRLHYSGMALTTASGIALVFAGYGLLHVCLVGAVYLVASTIIAVGVRRRVAAAV